MLPGFPTIEASYENSRYKIGGVAFYTDRSFERDLKQLSALIDAAKGGIPIIVAPFAQALEPLFASARTFYFVAPVCFETPAITDTRLIVSGDDVERLVNAISPDDRFHIHVLPQWQNLAPALTTAVRDILTRSAIRLKTIRHFGRLWPLNFAANRIYLDAAPDIGEISRPPEILVLAGPSLDRQVKGISGKKNIWCADTALPVLRHYAVAPQIVFSLDAGFASQEHFVGCHGFLQQNAVNLVFDPLVCPQVVRLPFSNRFTFASSHPLVQQFAAGRPDLTALINPQGNVGSLMLAAASQLFPDAKPVVLGHDGGHVHFTTHARGTAYTRRAAALHHRLFSGESYGMVLSRRYGPASLNKAGET